MKLQDIVDEEQDDPSPDSVGRTITDGGRPVGGSDRDLSDAKSKISEAKWTLESAARHEENPENARSYRHHAEQLGIAMDIVDRSVDTDTDHP